MKINEIWCLSTKEEIISVLWFIAAMLAWLCGFKWLFWMLLAWSLMGFFFSIRSAIRDARQEDSHRSN